MPEYVVTDPETGRKVKMTGDQPPTGEQIRAAFASLPPQEPQAVEQAPNDPRLADHLPNDPRLAALTIGSSVVAEPVAGLAGIAGLVGGLVPGGESPSEKGARFVEGTRGALTIDPLNEASEQVVSGIGTGLKNVINTAASIPFGHLGEEPGSRFEDTELARDLQQQGVNRQARVREEGLGEVLGSETLEATGSPALAAGVKSIPTAIASAAGLRTPATRVPKPTPKPTAKPTVANQPAASVGTPALDTPVDFTPASVVIQELRKNKPAKVAEAVVPDAKVIESAQRLHVDLNPEHYSTNAAFQDVARALKTQPGSKLQAKEVAALQKLSREADEVVLKHKGSIDKGEFSQIIGEELGTKIADQKTLANAAYDRVREVVPVRTKVNIKLIREYLDEQIADFGGDVSQLSKAEKKLLALTKLDGPPTYATIDNIRRNVGAGFSRSGPFKDGVQGNLEQVYGVLSDVQGGVARSFGAGDLYDAARGLVKHRKGLEDTAVSLFGRDLAGSLVPKIRGAATDLVKGDVARFNRLIHALPKARRAEAAATIIGDIFAGGSRRGGELSTGFAASWKEFNRHPTAKNALFSHLTPQARKSFDDIGRVITGIVESNRKSLGNPSGTAGGIIKALEDLTVVEKAYGFTKKAVAAEGVSTSVGLPGAGTAGVVGTMLAKQKTPIVVAADEMLASPAFARAVNEAVKGNVAQANKAIQSSSSYKKWFATLDDQTKANLATVGFISWITGTE